jgi:hypothetical protein
MDHCLTDTQHEKMMCDGQIGVEREIGVCYESAKFSKQINELKGV